jgi:hypothetical protein
MSTTDYLVFGSLAVIGALPFALAYLPKVKLTKPVAPSDAEWRDQWVRTLISLQGELDGKKMNDASILCRKLVWLILGGESTDGKK